MKTDAAQSPLVQGVRQKILKELSTGKYPLNEPLPTHRAWASRFQVSTTVVRQALDLLKAEQLLESKEGSYTFLRALPSPELLHKQSAPVRISTWVAGGAKSKDFGKMRKSMVTHQFQSQFRKRYPHVEFEERPIDMRSHEVEMLLVQSILQGPDPVLGNTTQSCLPFLTDHGALAPIPTGHPYLEKVKRGLLEPGTSQGQLRMLPSIASYSMLIFNKPLFRKAGLDPASPPRDWEELVRYAMKISLADGGKPSLHIHDSPTLVTWLMHLACQEDVITTGTRAKPIDWQSPSAKSALGHFAELHRSRLLKVHGPGGPLYLSRCLAGEFGMMVVVGALAETIAFMNQAENFGIAPLPKGPSGQVISLLNIGGKFVNAHATSQQQGMGWEYALAWEEWLHCGEGGSILKNLGVAPHLTSMLKETHADQFAASDLPSDWVSVLEQLEACSLWEPSEADWKKAVLGREMVGLLSSGEELSAEVLSHSFGIVEREAGFGQDGSWALEGMLA